MIASSKTAIVTCHAPYGAGGLGQHLAQAVEEVRSQGGLAGYYCTAPRADDGRCGIGRRIEDQLLPWRLNYTLARFSPGKRNYLCSDRFDQRVAATVMPGAETLIGFTGAVLRTFRKARGVSRLVVTAASNHADHVIEQHRKAAERHPFEEGWLSDANRTKMLQEYELADSIWVTSQHSRQIFLRHGIPEAKLQYSPLRPDPRFAAAAQERERTRANRDEVFRIVYVGSITVTKGLPILIEAFSKFTARPAELRLIGGTSTRGMARFMREAIARDPRIKIGAGDPLPYFLKADVCVHPSWDDAFGYAPMEALAIGLPVIVTEDTGMKDFVRQGENGYIVPTGETEPILALLEKLARN